MNGSVGEREGVMSNVDVSDVLRQCFNYGIEDVYNSYLIVIYNMKLWQYDNIFCFIFYVHHSALHYMYVIFNIFRMKH